MKRFFVLLIVTLCCLPGVAQTKKYFIEFTNKASTPYSLSEPQKFLSARSVTRRINQKISLTTRDLPVDPAYVQAIRQTGAKVWYTSRWMNAALVEADAISHTKIQKLAFVKSTSLDAPLTQSVQTGTDGRGKRFPARTAALDYGNSLKQNQMLDVPAMHTLGYTGKGIHIAVIDGGFYGVNTHPALKHVFDKQHLKGTYSFVTNQKDVYKGGAHGTEVFSAMAAYQPGALVGVAYDASYWLLTSENESEEYRIEEVNWLIAAEFADSVGVDIINTSLGYSTFDDPSMDYTPEQMDGKTALITRAASMAVATGMLVVTSAGNEGMNSWRTLTAPGDADSVLTIAAVTYDGNRAAFSSSGKLINGTTIKPTIAAPGQGVVIANVPSGITTSSGTSFASPLAAGLAAGLWQAYPELTNLQVMNYLKRSASQASAPDTFLGYGIPDFTKAYSLVAGDRATSASAAYLYPNPVGPDTEFIWFSLGTTSVTTPLELRFFDMKGNEVYTYTLSSPQKINYVSLPASVLKRGIYMVRCMHPQLQTALKLVTL